MPKITSKPTPTTPHTTGCPPLLFKLFKIQISGNFTTRPSHVQGKIHLQKLCFLDIWPYDDERKKTHQNELDGWKQDGWALALAKISSFAISSMAPKTSTFFDLKTCLKSKAPHSMCLPSFSLSSRALVLKLTFSTLHSHHSYLFLFCFGQCCARHVQAAHSSPQIAHTWSSSLSLPQSAFSFSHWSNAFQIHCRNYDKTWSDKCFGLNFSVGP